MLKHGTLRAREQKRARKSILITLMGPLLGLIGVLGITFFGAPTATAATSSYLNFQARLLTAAGAIVPDGNYNVEFKIYNASSSSGSSQGSCTGDAACQWVETRTGANQVRVAGGYLTVNLGSVNAFPANMPWDQQLWLTMNIGGTGTPSWDGEMNPRIQLTGVPYAFKAGAALNIQNASYTTLLTTSGNQISLPSASSSSSALTFNGDTTADLYRSSSGVLKTDGYLNAATGLQTNSTTRIDSGGNVINVANITASGNITLSAGGVNAMGYTTTNTSSSFSGQWTLLGTCTINAQFQDCHSQIEMINTSDGAQSNFHANVDFRVKQQNAMAGQPYVEVEASDLRSMTANQFEAVMTQNDASATVVSLYAQVNQSFQVLAFNPLINSSGSGATHQVQWFSNQGYNASLPAGVGSPSQFLATYSNAIQGTLSLQPAVDAANVLQVTNVAGSNLLSVDTSASNANLITTSDMESSSFTTANWVSKGSSTVSQTSAQYYQGTHSAQAIITAASSGMQTSAFSTSILPSTQYQLTFYARCSSTISTLTYGRQDVAGTDINGTTAGSCSSSGWNYYTLHFTTGATITSPNIYITMGTATTGTLYVDAVSLIQTTTSSYQPYYNGSIQVNGVINTPVTIMPPSNSITAFEVLNSAGTGGNFTVDTLNSRVNINTNGGYGANFSVGGTEIFRNTSNNIAGFQVQNSSAARILNIDTSTTVNKITNGDFEGNGTSGWAVKNGSTNSQVTTQAWNGNDSLQVAGSTSANSGASYAFTMSTGTQYTLSLYAKVASGTINDFVIGHQDVSGTDITCLTGQTLTTSWTRFSCTFTTGGTITSSNIFAQKSGGSAETFFIDGVQLQTGAAATPFNAGGGIQFGGVINSPTAFQNNNDSTTAFQIQNAAGTSSLLVADTLDNLIGIGMNPIATGATLQVDGNISAVSTINFTNTGNANQGIELNMVVTSAVTAGDVVVIDTINQGQVTDSTSANSTQVFGVATTTNSAGVAQPIVTSGIYQVNVDSNVVHVGDYLVTSNTTGVATATTSPSGGVIGQALSYKAGGASGQVWARINPGNGVGSSGSTGSPNYGLMESDWVNTGANLPGNLRSSSVATIGNTIYMFGGYNGTTASNKIYSAPVSNPTNWTDTSATLPGPLYSSQLAIVGSYLYLFGGDNGSGATNVIYRASVASPTSWTDTGSTIPASPGLEGSQLAIINNTIYLFGGYGSTWVNTIYTASVSSPTTWSTASGTLYEANRFSHLAVIGNYVYLFGGSLSGGTITNKIYRAPVSSPAGVGSWTLTSGVLPTSYDSGHLAIIGNYIYLFGGFTTTWANVVYRAPINNPVKGWVDTGSTLPTALSGGALYIAGNAVYIAGGYTGAETTAVYSAPIYNGSPDVSSNPSWRTDSNVGSGGGGSGTSSQTSSSSFQLSYAQKTSDTTITSTSDASPNSVVSSGSLTFDGNTPVWIEAYVSAVQNTAGGYRTIPLITYDSTVVSDIYVTNIAYGGTTNNTISGPFYLTAEVTPSAGAHTFALQARLEGAGTGYVKAGNGSGGSTYAPATLRVTLANPSLQGGSGGGINNGTVTQTANINIQSASANNPTAVIMGATSQSADVLDVQNSSSVNLMSVDPNGNVFVAGQLNVGGSIGFSNIGNQNQAITLNEIVTSATTAGDVVVVDASNLGQVTDSISANSTQVFGIATTTNSAGVSQGVVVSGIYQVNVDTAAVTVGNYLITSATTGRATASTSPSGGIVGQALSAKSAGSNGTVWARIMPANGIPGGSGNYIENTTVQQPSSNFNISSNGVVGGTLNVVGDILGNSKIAIRTNDTWLRLNPTSAFTAGIYGGTGIFRTDGQLQVGASGADFLVTNAGNVTAAGTFSLGSGTASTISQWNTTNGNIAINHGLIIDSANDANNGIYFGSAVDTNLYRSAANLLKTDDSLQVATNLGIGYDPTTITGGVAAFNGNVGIGTTGPQTALDVVGAMRNSSDLYSTGEGATRVGFLNAGGSTSGTTYFGIDYDSTNNAGRIQVLSGGVAWRNLELNPNGGNVGIGTASPASKLEVYGTAQAPATSGTATTAIMRVHTSTNVALDSGALGASPYSYWMQVTDVTSLGLNYPLALQPNGGSVGIGTTNPGAKLHVSGGNILIDNGYELQAKDPGGTIRNVLYARWTDDATYLDGGAGGLYLRASNGNVTGIQIQSNGNTAVVGSLTVAGYGVAVGPTSGGMRIEYGSCTAFGIGNSGDCTSSFSPAFSGTPTVTATPAMTVSGSEGEYFPATIESVSTSSVSIHTKDILNNQPSADVTFYWTAVGPE